VLFGAVAVVWFLLDQLSKNWAQSALDTRDVDLVGSLRFHLAFNTGASFSMGNGYGPWIALVALVIIAVLVWQGRTVTSRLGAVALGLIVGGALGNVADRALRGDQGFFHGAVIDFIDLQWWPVFNVADVGVVVGAVLLVVSTLLPPANGPDEARADGPDQGQAAVDPDERAGRSRGDDPGPTAGEG